jgi:hypothetical protein
MGAAIAGGGITRSGGGGGGEIPEIDRAAAAAAAAELPFPAGVTAEPWMAWGLFAIAGDVTVAAAGARTAPFAEG